MDLEKFVNAKYEAREEAVSVPALKDFFPAKSKPVWRVRGLSSSELARTREANLTEAKIKAFLDAAAGDNSDAGQKLRQAMGINAGEVHADISRRIEALSIASIEPVLGFDRRDVAVKLAETNPVTFYKLTNKIDDLTGQGSVLGKPKRSGTKPKSE